MGKVRVSLLTVIFSSVFFFLVKAILTPVAGKSITPFVFPAAVPLLEWQLKNSRPLVVPIGEDPSYLSGRQYQYVQNDLTLDIEMRYMVDTKGDVNSFIQNYSFTSPSVSKSLVLRQQEKVGFYGLFAYQQRVYLSACINSRGGSTVTDLQFRRNRDIYDSIYNLRFKDRLIPWLQGRGSIRDMRCLWAHLSIPLKTSSPNTTYQTLEKAWLDWYQWWRTRFPRP